MGEGWKSWRCALWGVPSAQLPQGPEHGVAASDVQSHSGLWRNQRSQITKRVPSKSCQELDSIQIAFLKDIEGPLYELGRGGAGGGAGWQKAKTWRGRLPHESKPAVKSRWMGEDGRGWERKQQENTILTHFKNFGGTFRLLLKLHNNTF